MHDGSFHNAIQVCLEEAPVDGICTTWGTELTNYGTMPDWDTSLVTNMDGHSGSTWQGFAHKTAFNGDISGWDTSQVTSMNNMFQTTSSFNSDISLWNTSQFLF